ncbi:MAG: glutamine--fructose-6-phosphate transaminase (isomerizing) [Rikenellaceae bacterium]
MCGIVGYIGSKDAYPILIKGLKRLEYRGYDSAGVALIDNDNNLNIYKEKGKVSDLEAYAQSRNISGCIGIAHTRWATHGEPCQRNSHPHYSESEDLAIIHNGIIENYATIRKNLEEKGVTFKSDTDTEVLIQLIEYVQRSSNLDLMEAIQVTLHQVIGAYAIAILDKNNPNQIIAARKSSPLVLGVGDGEFFLGSDATPIIEYTDQIIYLKDGEIAHIRLGEELKIVDIDNIEVIPEIKTIELSLGQIEKGGYPHFMLKEIFEQPKCIADCMRGRVHIEQDKITMASIIDNEARLTNATRYIIVACGTSWHAALIGKQLIETFVQIPVDVEYASEFRYRNPVILPTDVVIAISQSGETADTLAAVELAKDKGAFVYGICNAVGSSLSRVTDSGAYIHVGPEIGVASTKAFTGQVTVLSMLAMVIGKKRRTLDGKECSRLVRELNAIPSKMEEVLKVDAQVKEISKMFTYASNFLYLGRGYNYPVALEGALKLKEISYIHAEGYPAAEMKHGPIALIDEQMPIIVVATKNDMYEKVLSNIQEIKARKGRVIALVTKGDTQMSSIADETIEIPEVEPCFEPLITTIPLQLISYYIAMCKGCDVDQPRNLAKSVTVE